MCPIMSAVIRFVFPHVHAINGGVGDFVSFLVVAHLGFSPWEPLRRVFPLEGSPRGSISLGLGFPAWCLPFLCLSVWIH